MSNVTRSNVTMTAALSALVISLAQRHFGIVLTNEDVAALMALTLAAWHAVCVVFERYFPPPNPTTPEKPAQEQK